MLTGDDALLATQSPVSNPTDDISKIDFTKVFERIANNKDTQHNSAVFLNQEEKYISKNVSLSYLELNSLSNQLAHYLLKNVPKGATICLFLEQSAAAIIIMFACWKAGYPFMPLNPNVDEISVLRLKNFFENTNSQLIITHSHYKDHPFLFTVVAKAVSQLFFDIELPTFSSYSVVDPSVVIDLDSPAYIINSSGSTGVPKKIRIPRRGLYSCVLGIHQVFNFKPSDQIMLFANLVFDAAILDVLMPLLYGAQAHIPPVEIRKDAVALSKFIKNQGINVTVLPPAMLRLLEPCADLKTLDRVISTGEIIDLETINKWSHLNILDGYGPAEVRIATWVRKIKFNPAADQQISYEMHVIPGLEFFILTAPKEDGEPVSLADLKPVCDGDVGEIYITGTGLGEYLDKQLSSQRFPTIQHPDSGLQIRVFQTHDLAVKDKSGNVEIKGRTDKQRKIDGELFCPEEIEAALRSADDNIAIAYVDIDETKNNQIRAYLKLKVKSKPLYLPALYERIVNSLSMKMAPAVWCILDEIVLNSSFKISHDDLRKFRQLEGTYIQSFSKEEAQDEIEAKITKIIFEILNIPLKALYREDNILYLGAKSLHCAAILRSLRSEFRYCNFRMTLPEFMEAPTIANVARVIRRLQDLPGSSTYNEVSQFNTIGPEKNVSVILLPSLMGQPDEDYARLKEHWPYQRQLYLLFSRGRDSLLDIDNYPMAVARDDAKTIVKSFPDPDKPLFLAGWSLGGLRGLLLKQVLEKNYGRTNVRLLMFDTEAASVRQRKTPAEFAAHLLKFYEEKLQRILQIELKECGINKSELEKMPNEHQVYWLFDNLNHTVKEPQLRIKKYLIATIKNNFLYVLRYAITALVNHVTLIAANKTQSEQSMRLGHSPLVQFEEIITVEGNHESILLGTGVKKTAELMNAFCEKQEIAVNLDKIRTKLKRPIDIDEAELEYYIPARGSYEASDKEDFDLAQRVIQILNDEKTKSILLLGPPAVGKSTFLQFLTKTIKDKLVLYIKLSKFQNPAENLIEQHLERLELTKDEIAYVKKHCHLIICCDDYDEIDKERFRNLIASNRMFEWNLTVIFGVRSSYILSKYSGKNYRTLFYPMEHGKIDRESFKEIYARPFTSEQIENYIKKYLENMPPYLKDNLKDEYKKPDIYIKYLDIIPGARKLCAIPFFLRLYMEILPLLLDRYEGKRVDEFEELTQQDLFDMATKAFTERQFDKMAASGMPLDIDYPAEMEEFSIRLATEMYKQGVCEVPYTEALRLFRDDQKKWQEYFGVSNDILIKVREGCLIRQTPAPNAKDGYVFSFLHPELMRHYYFKYLAVTPPANIIKSDQPGFSTLSTLFHKPLPLIPAVIKQSATPVTSGQVATPVLPEKHGDIPDTYIPPITRLDAVEQEQLELALQLSKEEKLPLQVATQSNDPNSSRKQLSSKVAEILNAIGVEDKDVKLLGDINVSRGEVNYSICNIDNYYTSDFINLWLHHFNQTPLIKIYPAISLELLSQFDQQLQRQDKRYAFIPINVAYDEKEPQHKNHWIALIIDKKHRLIFYLDPALKKTAINQIEILKAFLNYQQPIIFSPIDFQTKEKQDGWIRHCGVYVIEIFNAFTKCVQNYQCITGSQLPNVEIDNNSLPLQSVLSSIPCGEVEAVSEIRISHIEKIHRILTGNSANQSRTQHFSTVGYTNSGLLKTSANNKDGVGAAIHPDALTLRAAPPQDDKMKPS